MSLLTNKDDNGHPIMYGAVVCSWGLHATLVADSDTAEYRKHGIKRFAMAAQEALSPADGTGPHRYKAKVSLQVANDEGTSWTQVENKEHSYVMATLVSNLEEKFTISPASKPLSGALRFVYFGYVSGDEAMRIMTLAYQDGAHVKDDAVDYSAVDALLIDFAGEEGEADGRWRRICVDGKIVRVNKGGYVEVKNDKRSVLELTVLH
jgi:diacylglycerol kinase family enzyme